MPFADYDDFEACERANSDKRDPGAYCAAIRRATEQFDGDPADVTVESLADLDVTADELDALADESAAWEAHDMDAGRVWTDGAGAAVYQAGEDDSAEEQQARVAGEAVVIDGLSDEARESISEKYNVEIRDADADAGE